MKLKLQAAQLDPEVSQYLDEVATHFIKILDSKYRHMEEQVRDAWLQVAEQNYKAATTTLQVAPMTENPFQIDSVVVYVGLAAGGLGLLELGGDCQLPVPVGLSVFSMKGVRLSNTDFRILSTVTNTNGAPGARGSGAAGYLYLGLFGKEVPREVLRE